MWRSISIIQNAFLTYRCVINTKCNVAVKYKLFLYLLRGRGGAIHIEQLYIINKSGPAGHTAECEFTTNGKQNACMHGPVSNLLAVMDPPGACKLVSLLLLFQ